MAFPPWSGDETPPSRLSGRRPLRLPAHPTAVRQAGGSFVFIRKPSSHRTIAAYIDGAELNERRQTVVVRGKRTTTVRRWLSAMPLRATGEALEVDWFSVEILNNKGRRTYYNSFVTDLTVTAANVAELAAGGRARWRIENETFNVLKTGGYNLEHNFGHGKEILVAVLVTLNLLAFAGRARLAASRRPPGGRHTGSSRIRVPSPLMPCSKHGTICRDPSRPRRSSRSERRRIQARAQFTQEKRTSSEKVSKSGHLESLTFRKPAAWHRVRDGLNSRWLQQPDRDPSPHRRSRCQFDDFGPPLSRGTEIYRPGDRQEYEGQKCQHAGAA